MNYLVSGGLIETTYAWTAMLSVMCADDLPTGTVGVPAPANEMGSVAAPDAASDASSGARFVVQLHDATTLHFDLRLEVGGVLRSWAVPKGPSLNPAVRRLALAVEDHNLTAGQFEGLHERGARGSGAVIIWDEGTVEILRDEPDHLSFQLRGVKLSGRFGLSRTGERRWILVKASDQHARPGRDIVAESPGSVRTGRTWQQVAGERSPTDD